MTLRAPFPWFGGKSRVADVVWRAFGNVPNYVEPFAGSLAVLLGRPHEAKIETVNDLDCMLANFWRAVTENPDAVAEHCDWPVNEVDLHARHRWLVAQLTGDFRERMRTEADYFDTKIAGWWVWGLSMWIGSGWCQESRVDRNAGQMPSVNGRSAGMGVHRKLPDLYTRGLGRGVRAANPERGTGADIPGLPEKRPNARNGGQGIHAGGLWQQAPVLHGGGRGVHAPSRLTDVHEKSPAIDGHPSGRGVHRLPDLMGSAGVVNGQRGGRWADGAPVTEDGPPAREWFRALQSRLRRVRVCCGEWDRVLTPSVLGTTKSRNSGMNPCGVLLDSPYASGERAEGLYSSDDGTISARVAEWAREHGEDRDLRIALCGYEGEHEMPGWSCHAWQATRGYSGDDNDNRSRERIWFSPHCLPLVDPQVSLFGEAG